MKKILLIGINARYTHSCLALYCLKSFAGGLDYEIAVREFSINQDIDAILADIIHEKPFAVGLSVYIWNAAIVKKLLSVMSENSDGVTIILGGPEVSYNPGQWLAACPRIDYIVAGPGEQGFRDLLEGGCTLPDRIISSPNPRFTDIPFPYSREDLAALGKKYVYYESSRGCPHRCSYCLSSRNDQKLDMKSLDRVRDELDVILQFRPGLVKFIDRTFNAEKKTLPRHMDFFNRGIRPGANEVPF